MKVEEAETSFGCDWHQDCPRLFVKRGVLRVGDVMVRSDEQILWVADRSLVAEKIQGKLAWLDKAQQKSNVPKAFREKMLSSVDFIDDLDKPESIGNRGQLVLAQQWSAALEPEKGLMPVLENADAKIRRDAVAWLLTLPPKHPRTRLMWRIISSQASAPEFTRSFFRMTQLARAAAPISHEDATLLLRGLEHDRLFVRQVSQLFLETGFGNLGNYQADAPPEIRRRTIDAWTREINQRYTATRNQ